MPACLGLMARKTPFHLVVLDIEDGLDLIADYLEREELFVELSPGAPGEPVPGPEEYAKVPYPVLSRAGLGRAFGEIPGKSERELFETLSREPSGPKLYPCEPADMSGFIASRLVPRPDEGLLIYGPKRVPRVSQGLAEALRPWGDAGFWAELAEGELRVSRWVQDRLDSAILAHIDSQDRFVLHQGWNFLQPLGPIKPQRLTLEEPPKSMKPGIYRGPKTPQK